MSNFRINETHIMVIRKDSATGKLVTDYLPLEFKEQAKLNELKKLSNMLELKKRSIIRIFALL